MQRQHELILRGGHVLDGTGAPPFEADVAVSAGRIAAVGRLARESAAHEIDVSGLVVAPGFIDVHTHLELEEEHSRIEDLPTADNLLFMGVTTAVTGNCGGSELPLAPWFDRLERLGVSINVASLVGHNTVRRAAMGGDFARPPAPDELQRMCWLVGSALEAGAVGLSSGLVYVPGSYASTAELIELASVAARHGALYATHLRDEGELIEEAVAEALEIGERARCAVQISHFKISSQRRWGDSLHTARLVADARARGLPVHVDQYLYASSSTTIAAMFPRWVFDGGARHLEARLRHDPTRIGIRAEIIATMRARGRQDFSYARIAHCEARPQWDGWRIPELALEMRGSASLEDQAETAIELLLLGGALMIYDVMSEQDVEHIFLQPFTMVACDGGVIALDAAGAPHPRSFGNNALVLGELVRERRLVPLQEAVRRMTGLPAEAFGFQDRGRLLPGLAADLVAFDPGSVAARATFERPKQHASGFAWVLVNGRVVIEQGRHTGARPGRVLRRLGRTRT
jgi:N-acyl-D-amino-acid deacylase